MSVEKRKRDLFEKHDHISAECSKINKFICLAFEKSENVLRNIDNINDNDLLTNFTRIYKFLSNLHLELIDITCQLELFFMNSEKDENEQFVLNNITNAKLQQQNNVHYKTISKSNNTRNNVNHISYDIASDVLTKESTSGKMDNVENINNLLENDQDKNNSKNDDDVKNAQNTVKENINQAITLNDEKNNSKNDNEGVNKIIVQNTEAQNINQAIILNDEKNNSKNDNEGVNKIIVQNTVAENINQDSIINQKKIIDNDTEEIANEKEIKNYIKNEFFKISLAETEEFDSIQDKISSENSSSFSDINFENDEHNLSFKSLEEICSVEAINISLNKLILDKQKISICEAEQNLNLTDTANALKLKKVKDENKNEYYTANELKKIEQELEKAQKNNLVVENSSDVGKSPNTLTHKSVYEVSCIPEPNILENLITTRSKNEEYENMKLEYRPIEILKSNESVEINMEEMKFECMVQPKHEAKSNIQYNKNTLRIQSMPDPIEGDYCCLGYVKSPSHFYIQIACEEATYINSMSVEIQETLCDLQFFCDKNDAMSIIDRYCVCYCETNQDWFRAEIIDWLPDNEDMVLVQLIDFSYIIEVPLIHLREISPYLCNVPKVTVKCHLAWLVPPNHENDSVDFKWPEDSIKFFKNKLKPNLNCLYTLNLVERIGNSLAIDLSADDMPSIIELMLCEGKAKSNLPEYLAITSDVNNLDECSNMLTPVTNYYMEPKSTTTNSETFSEFMRQQIRVSQGYEMSESDFEVEEEHTNANMAIAHYDPKDEREICRFINKSGGCFKGANCRFSHTPLNPDGWTTDTELIYYRAFNCLDLPAAGMTAKVKVMCIKDLRTFYVHIKSFPDRYKSIFQPVNSLKSLEQMMNNADEVRSFKVPAVMPALSQIILVKYADNWQRAQVIDTNEHCNEVKLTVLLVDIGYTVTVNLKQTRDIKQKYLIYPFQAVRCVLINTKLKDELTEEQLQTGLDYLEMISLEKTLEAKVLYSSLHLGVLLYDETGQDIGEQLIHAGLVEECTDIVVQPTNHKMLVD